MNIQKYFKDEIIDQNEIKGHFNKNFKVKTKTGFFHLKIFKNNFYKIKKWIDGDVVKEWNEKNIQMICNALMILHKKNVDWKIMDYNLENINNSTYINILEKYKNDKFVACHNDLNKDNIIIKKNKAIFIDFEFKRLNNKYWDIANIINEDNLKDFHIKLFLKYYNGLQENKLKEFIFINKHFNKYWKSKFM